MNLSLYIDHTCLKPDSSESDIRALCKEAMRYHFYAVCVPPFFVSHARKVLSGSAVRVATVAGFPMGFYSIAAKEKSVQTSIDSGADEVDIVINVSAVKSADWSHIQEEIRYLQGMARRHGVTAKFIFETGLLEKSEIEKLCLICNAENTDFVKTSTGYYGEGASVYIVTMLRRLLDQDIRIKASGGIRTYDETVRLIRAGADRIGASKGVQILSGEQTIT